MPKVGKGALTRGAGGTIFTLLFVTTLITLMYNFWLAPYLFGGLQFSTIAQVFTSILSFQIAGIVLLGLWLAWWFGYIGIAFASKRRR